MLFSGLLQAASENTAIVISSASVQCWPRRVYTDRFVNGTPRRGALCWQASTLARSPAAVRFLYFVSLLI